MSETSSNSKPYFPKRIISGGQTGVDRAALDFARCMGWQHGGWCPKGRLSEAGVIPACYDLDEAKTSSYPARTRLNVRDSDATLIIYAKPMGPGTALTLRICRELGKPHFATTMKQGSVTKTLNWLLAQRPECLNIAGPRESGHPGIYEQCTQWLDKLFTLAAKSGSKPEWMRAAETAAGYEVSGESSQQTHQ
ncbi:MAG: putative molybdenum carrier protein [Planctomycetota bacterium]